MGLGLSGKWMTRISGAELPWHGEASFSGWQDEGWGSLVSSQDSKQKASEMRRAGWICQCLVPWGAQFRLTLTLHSQDKSLCHSSPSLPRHKFNLSSIIFTEEPEYTHSHRWNGRETFFLQLCYARGKCRDFNIKELFFLKGGILPFRFLWRTAKGGEGWSQRLPSHTHAHSHKHKKWWRAALGEILGPCKVQVREGAQRLCVCWLILHTVNMPYLSVLGNFIDIQICHNFMQTSFSQFPQQVFFLTQYY